MLGSAHYPSARHKQDLIEAQELNSPLAFLCAAAIFGFHEGRQYVLTARPCEGQASPVLLVATLQDMLGYQKDILVTNCRFLDDSGQPGADRCDSSSWRETPESLEAQKASAAALPAVLGLVKVAFGCVKYSGSRDYVAWLWTESAGCAPRTSHGRDHNIRREPLAKLDQQRVADSE